MVFLCNKSVINSLLILRKYTHIGIYFLPFFHVFLFPLFSSKLKLIFIYEIQNSPIILKKRCQAELP